MSVYKVIILLISIIVSISANQQVELGSNQFWHNFNKEFDEFNKRFDVYFDNVFKDINWTEPLDFSTDDTGENFELTMKLPGVQSNDISVKQTANTVTIDAAHHHLGNPTSYRSYHQVHTIPAGYAPSGQWSFLNDQLTVVIPRKVEDNGAATGSNPNFHQTSYQSNSGTNIVNDSTRVDWQEHSVVSQDEVHSNSRNNQHQFNENFTPGITKHEVINEQNLGDATNSNYNQPSVNKVMYDSYGRKMIHPNRFTAPEQNSEAQWHNV